MTVGSSCPTAATVTQVDGGFKLDLLSLTMKTSDTVAEATPVVETPAEVTPGVVDGAPVAPSPFELLPVGEAFGVCSVDGVCS